MADLTQYVLDIPSELSTSQPGAFSLEELTTRRRDPLLFLYMVEALATIDMETKAHPPTDFDALKVRLTALSDEEAVRFFEAMNENIIQANARFVENRIYNLERRKVITGEDGSYQLQTTNHPRKDNTIISLFIWGALRDNPFQRELLDDALRQVGGTPPPSDIKDELQLCVQYKKAFGDLSAEAAKEFTQITQFWTDRLALGFHKGVDHVPEGTLVEKMQRQNDYCTVAGFFIPPEKIASYPQAREAYEILQESLRNESDKAPLQPRKMLDRFLALPEEEAIHIVGRMKECFRVQKITVAQQAVAGNVAPSMSRRIFAGGAVAGVTGVTLLANSSPLNIVHGDAVSEPASELHPNPVGEVEQVSFTCPEPLPKDGRPETGSVSNAIKVGAGAAVGIAAKAAYDRRGALARLLTTSNESERVR